jgi:putative PIN family toxin of toxin-antitoxin system
VRVVFDTVVLVRGLLEPSSWSGRLLFDLSNAYEWVVSPDIVTEYREVIRRPRLVKKYRSVANYDLQTLLARIATATLVTPAQTPAICREPADDKFLAAAIAGSARFIVSEDKDLLDLGNYAGSQIVTAEAFLRILDGDGVTRA